LEQTAVVLLAVIVFPGQTRFLYDVLWWYPVAFVVGFYLKRRALLARAQAMLDSTNARMRADAAVSKPLQEIVKAYGAVAGRSDGPIRHYP
jgi:hypothetical protein